MAGIKTEDFFQQKRNTSEIKSEVFVKYFKFWCAILLFAQKYRRIESLLYIDLYSGPGYYENGEPSTPIKILNSIYTSKDSNIDLNKSVQTFFNDEKLKLVLKLKQNIEVLPYYDELRNKPILLNENANHDLLKALLKKSVPSLTFIDPFGYSYSMEMLLNSVKDWGSDLFMLFNINRIRAAINNPLVEGLMNEIFQNQLNEIRKYYNLEKSPRKREEFILSKFEKLFIDRGYMLFKFKINFPNKNLTSHYLYLVSKVKIAYYKIKEIMKEYSDYQPDGVPLFAANTTSPPIFFPELEKFSIVNLETSLKKNLNQFSGLTIEQVYEKDSINTHYIKSNYKVAFENLLLNRQVELIDAKGKETKKVTYTAKIK